MNNVKPDCCKVVDFLFLCPIPHDCIFKKSYTPENRLLFFYDFLMLIVILEWEGGAIGFAK